MTHHDLKCSRKFFSDVSHDRKSFELRKNDRDYRKGDTMTLREWDQDIGYTGRSISRRITYIMEGGQYGLEEGYVAMSIR